MQPANLRPQDLEVTVDPLSFARRLRTPIWVYDTDHQRIAYANKQACKLWNAADEASLQDRDFSKDMSITVANRLRQYQSDFKEQDAEFSETWTIHPDGKAPVTLNVIYTGFPMLDGRMGMLCEAVGEAEQTSETLRSTKALLHTDVIIAMFSLEGHTLYKNPAAKKLLPYNNSEVNDIFVASRDLEDIQAAWYKAGECRKVAKIKTSNGERWLDLDIKQCLDAVSGEQALLITAFDVTELKAVKAVSKLRQEQLEATFSAALDGIVIIDINGTILEFNGSSRQIFGYAKRDIIGKNIELIIPERYREKHNQGMVRMLKSGETRILGKRIEIEAIRANGEEFMSELAISRSGSSNGQIFIAYIRDISEAKATEKALLDAKNAAEMANSAKSQFLANMSHEIRTPMNGVLGMLDVLRGTQLSERQLNYTDIIHRSGTNLLAILSDILDFSKIEAGKLTLNPEACNLEEALEDVVQLFEGSANEKTLSLSFEYAPNLPKTFIADVDRVRQIVTNLIGNAIKFTSEGTITVNVSGKVEQAHAYVRVDVKDTGIGISPDKLALIFEKFTQAENSTTRQYGGTGLGLAISRQLAVAMNGQLTVTSDLGHGTTFTLELPLEITTLPAIVKTTRRKVSAASSFPKHSIAQAAGLSLKFLVVEDDEKNRAVIRDSFKHPRIKISYAETALLAIDTCGREKFDVIFMGTSIPIMNLGAAIKSIREKTLQSGQARTPIISMTEPLAVEDRERFLQSGMDDHLAKPLQKDQLHKLVSKWLKAARAASQTH